jgi:hypothetical protein
MNMSNFSRIIASAIKNSHSSGSGVVLAKMVRHAKASYYYGFVTAKNAGWLSRDEPGKAEQVHSHASEN